MLFNFSTHALDFTSMDLFLKQLCYINPQQKLSYETENCFVMKSGSTLIACNRVCSITDVSDDNVRKIISHFNNIPFRWIVYANQTAIRTSRAIIT